MLNTINDKEISNEINERYKPTAASVGNTNLPLCDLSDRDFEVLTYHLITAEIENGEHDKYSKVSLMQGVGERGRDCVIYYNDDIVAIVQCKKYKANITRPSFLKELVKFLLHLTLDSDLYSGDNVNYLFYVSKSLTEQAIKLTKQFGQEIINDIDNGNINKFIREVVLDYVSFESYVDKEPYDEIIRLLKKTTVQVCDETDLSYRIKLKPNVLKSYFNVLSIVDSESNKKDLSDVLERFGFPDLSDIDVKHIQRRIKHVSEEKRINFGTFDFYGYDINIFKHLSNEEIGDLFKAVTNVSTFMDKHLFNFLQFKINEATQKQISEIFLFRNNIVHPYTVSLIPMYLVKICNSSIIVNTMPESMRRKLYPEHFMPKEDVMNIVIDEMVNSSEKFLKGDYSLIKGSESEIKFKINSLFPHLHNGLSSVKAIRDQVKKDLMILNPTIENIEREIRMVFESEKTIVIKDSHISSDKEMLPKIRGTFDKLK